MPRRHNFHVIVPIVCNSVEVLCLLQRRKQLATPRWELRTAFLGRLGSQVVEGLDSFS